MSSGGTGASAAQARLRDGQAVIAIVTGGGRPLVLMDGTQLFSVQTAQGALALIGMGVFHVPFVGNVATFALGAALFLLVTPGMGAAWYSRHPRCDPGCRPPRFRQPRLRCHVGAGHRHGGER
jgi:hypothetical protein